MKPNRFQRVLRSMMGISDLVNPADWLLNIFGGGSTSSGEKITNDGAFYNSNVYTCAAILGGDIGKLPLVLYQNNKGNIVKDTQHPVSELLGIRPNRYMSAYTFKELMIVHMALWGNAYAWIEWDQNGWPKSLTPLNPALTEVYMNLETLDIWYVTTLPNGKMITLLPSDLLHFKMLGNTGLKGVTPISVIREKIGSQQATDKFLSSFYANGTATRGILKVPGQLEKGSKERAREEWQKANSGIENAHRIAILDAGLEYQNLTMPLKDAEFIETAKFGILEVAKIYKIPPHKVGQLDRATFSNIEHQSLEYVKNTLQPIATNWEQEINYKLFTAQERKRYYVRFNMLSELRGDSTSRAAYYKEMLAWGVYTINEVRALEEAANIGDDGDQHLVPTNYTTLKKLVSNPIQPDQKGGDNS